MGTLKAVDKNKDISFGNFPWLLIGGIVVALVGGGLVLRRVLADL